MQRVLWFGLIYCLWASTLGAQMYTYPKVQSDRSPYKIAHFNTENGFLQDGAAYLYPDEEAYLWVQNQTCLIQMDAGTQEIYQKLNSPAIQSNRLGECSYLKEGGLICYGESREEHFFYIDSKRGAQPFSKKIAQSKTQILDTLKSGYFLHSSANQLLSPADPGKINYNIKFPDKQMYSLTKDTLYYFIDYQLQKSTPLPATTPRADFVLVDDQLFYFAANEQVNFHPIFEGRLESPVPLAPSPFWQALKTSSYYQHFKQSPNHCLIQLDDTLWRLQLQAGRLSAQKMINGLAETVSDVVFDASQKRLFLADRIKGLFIFEPYDPFFKMGDYLTSFTEVVPGKIGLWDTVQPLKAQDQVMPHYSGEHYLWKRISPDSVIQLLEDTIWLWDQQQKQVLFSFDHDKYGFPKDVMGGQNQLFWYLSSHRITASKRSEIVFDSLFGKPHFDPPLFYCLAEVPGSEAIWIGSTEGIYRIDQRSLQMDKLAYCAGMRVRNIRFMEDSIALVGTYGDGAYLIKDGRTIPINGGQMNQYLAYSHCFQEDQEGYIWISTNNGLLRTHKADLLGLASGEIDQAYFHRFSREDGLPTNEFNGLKPSNSQLLSNGELAFASTVGVVHFDPTKLLIDPLPENIYFRSAAVDGQALDLSKEIILPANFNDLSIQTGRSAYWGKSENLVFQYRLLGYQEDWQAVPLSGTLQFNRYHKGDFRLQLRLLKNRQDSEEPLLQELNFRMTPKLTERTVFPVLLIMLGIVLSYLVFRSRSQYLLQQKRKLETQVEVQSQKLKARNDALRVNISAKNLLISILNHDISGTLRFLSPLAKGLAQNIQKTELDPEQKQDALLVAESVQSLQRQSQVYLNWIRAEKLGKNFTLGWFQLDNIIWEITAELSNKARLAKKPFVLKYPTNIKMFSHPFYIRSILHNILENCLKFSDPGKITIRGVAQTHQLLILDEGALDFDYPAINAFLKDPLEPTPLAKTQTKPSQQGLGLYIVRDLLIKNGATLELRKQDGLMEYWLTFPSDQ